MTKNNLNALVEFQLTLFGLSETEAMQYCIDIATQKTASQIGYFHFVNEDQETIELGTWSSGTLEFCKAVYERHYPIDQAGIWADCARFKRYFMHNDYQSLNYKKGYPQGHVHLIRHLGVPVIENDKVYILAGVGNKEKVYTHKDMIFLEKILQLTWQYIKQNRVLQQLKCHKKTQEQIQQDTLISFWHYDREIDQLTFDEYFSSIFALASPTTLAKFLALFPPEDVHTINEIFDHINDKNQFSLKLMMLDKLVLLEGKSQKRIRGQHYELYGFVQDITFYKQIKTIEFKAYHDTLTGLANRHKLNQAVRKLMVYNFAILYMDLDKFKPINDHYGHAVGDEVLKIVAKRLITSTRKTDLVVRMGGDEFLILQSDVRNKEDAATLAKKIICEVKKEIKVEDYHLDIGISIGIALNDNTPPDFIGLLNRADKALYAAKAQQGGCFFIDNPE